MWNRTVYRSAGIWLFLVLAVMVGCKQEDATTPVQDPDVQVLKVNPRLVDGNRLDMLPYVEAVYQPEDEENILLSDMSTFRPFEEYIFILDDHLNTLYCLDTNFQFLYKLLPQGKGPGEFSDILDFVYDEARRRLTVHDNTLMKTLDYDESGTFLEEHSLGMYTNNIIPVGDKFFTFNYEYKRNPYNYLLRLKRADYTIDDSFFEPRFATYENLFNTYTFVKNFLGTLYHHTFDYQVYSLHVAAEPKLEYQIDFGSKAAMRRIEKMSMYQAEDYVRKHDLVFHTIFFTPLDSTKFYFEFRMGGDIFCCVFNQESQTHKIYRKTVLHGLDARMTGSDVEGNLYLKLTIAEPEEQEQIEEIIADNPDIRTNMKAGGDFMPNFILVKVNGNRLAELVE